MPLKKLLTLSLVALFALAGRQAYADTATYTGIFSTDDQTQIFNLTLSASQIVNIYSTSYGGGTNADGTTTLAGGFVPVLTLFNADGTIIGPSTTGGAMDPVTSLSNDAYLNETLGAGSYLLALSEFPNAAIGNLGDGFIFAGSPNITGDICGVPSGTFLETDVAPCVQRTGSYAVNISTTVTPEPATWLLVLPATGFLFVFGKRSLS